MTTPHTTPSSQASQPAAKQNVSGLRLAGGIFTVLPFKPVPEIDRQAASKALAWLPWLGLLLGAVAGAVVAALGWLGAGSLLYAVAGVGLVEALTGFLHLDGVADTSDALGSRKPPEQALEIMKQHDIGPMGVAAVMLCLLTDVAAVASASSWRSAALLVLLAPLVGRLACLLAYLPHVPLARPGGFGALFAATTTPLRAVASTLSVLALCAGAGFLAGGWQLAAWLAASLLFALVAGAFWVRYLVGRFGGLTGDTYGSLIELATTVFLVVGCLRV